MSRVFFDVGITAPQVANHLAQSPVVSIVGFQRSGKSTLAEILDEDLSQSGYSVLMQNATSWLRRQATTPPGKGTTPASVDPEIVYAIEQLDQNERESCWIVDDAEVMLAYATETILRNLGARVQNRRFSVVLIRNRFIHEEEGWFQQRLAMILPHMHTLTMQRLEERYAVEMATTMFQGESRFLRGEWLASMSGGIPGLMSDLHPYSPEWPPEEPTPQLIRLANQKRKELDLEKPMRHMLVTALAYEVLPPVVFLSEQAERELGGLAIAGMVSLDYATDEKAFNGDFWSLVSGQKQFPVSIRPALVDIGLNLEIMIREAGLMDVFSRECGIPSPDEGLLGKAFAATLHCEEHFPRLVRPLKTFLTESLGAFGLSQILMSRGVSPMFTASPAQLAEALFRHARL